MIKIFFGSPGCGKTTTACMFLKKKSKKYSFEYANFENTLCPYQDTDGLGTWSPPPDSLYMIDEAGITYNNRLYKTLPKEQIQWFKLHRHYGVDVYLFSQSWEDMDITLRRLCDELWYCQKRGPFTICRKVIKSVTVDEQSQQIIDGYKFVRLWRQFAPFPFHREAFKVIFRPRWYKYFDSWSRKELPLPPCDQKNTPQNA